MMLHIPSVLTPEELEPIQRVLRQSTFIDGKLTAGQAAERVKHNLELDREAPQKEVLAKIVMTGLYRSELFKLAAMPLKVATPIFARYIQGMGYGSHIDDPIMGAGPHYRTDVSFTVFLTDPDEYEGGDLSIRTPFGLQQVKLPAGDAVIYPSGTLHYVAEVTGGERLVAVGWIQSMVRDPGKREILFNLGQARAQLLATGAGGDANLPDWIDHSYINLMRMWAEL